MALPKWTKKDLQDMDELGYKVVPCDTEEKALEVKQVLKKNKRCAQAGRIINREGKTIYFVLTKERGATKSEK